MSGKEFHHLQNPLAKKKKSSAYAPGSSLPVVRRACPVQCPPLGGGEAGTPSPVRPRGLSTASSREQGGPPRQRGERAISERLWWLPGSGVDVSQPAGKGRRLLLNRKINGTCLGFTQRLKIPTTCSLLAPTCLYGCDC